jgi:glycosyltransferase involved in cell wall biosynthesis
MIKPTLSIIVIAYKMASQLERTLYTLSTEYQRDVAEHDYELVVVENGSDEMLSPAQINNLESNVRYFSRKDLSNSPVAAVNFGFEQCRGSFIGLLIDGAHMVSPRVIKYALLARLAVPHPVVVVPGYHLGHELQDNNNDYDQVSEAILLGELDWRSNGYRLFEVSTLSPANQPSYLHPIMECNCVFASYLSFKRIGFCDERFTLKGGGSINLHIYRQLGILPESEIVVLPGEGSFHQYHNGVTTSNYVEQKNEIDSHKKQLASIWGCEFQAVRKEPILLGAVTYWAQKGLEQAAKLSQKRYERLTKLGRPVWQDEKLSAPTMPFLTIEEAEKDIPN